MSGYKGYKPEDNIRRKSNNTGEVIDTIGQNQNVKSYSSKPGQLAGWEQNDQLEEKNKHRNAKQPVRTLSKEEKAKVEVPAFKPPKYKYKRPVVLMTDDEFTLMIKDIKTKAGG